MMEKTIIKKIEKRDSLESPSLMTKQTSIIEDFSNEPMEKRSNDFADRNTWTKKKSFQTSSREKERHSKNEKKIFAIESVD